MPSTGPRLCGSNSQPALFGSAFCFWVSVSSRQLRWTGQDFGMVGDPTGAPCRSIPSPEVQGREHSTPRPLAPQADNLLTVSTCQLVIIPFGARDDGGQRSARGEPEGVSGSPVQGDGGDDGGARTRARSAARTWMEVRVVAKRRRLNLLPLLLSALGSRCCSLLLAAAVAHCLLLVACCLLRTACCLPLLMLLLLVMLALVAAAAVWTPTHHQPH